MNEEYFDRSGSWAADQRLLDEKSRRTAWTVAGIAAAVALFEAVALAVLLPLKSVDTVTLLVDRQTGHVQALDPNSPRRVIADEALTQSYLAQYVAAREGFDRATIAADYRKVALWSSGTARSSYLAEIPATNPASPFNHYPAGDSVSARVKSISRLDNGVALVRFDSAIEDRSGILHQPQPWVAIIRYRYSDGAMAFEDRLLNPLGFQVLAYRRNPEAPGLESAPAVAGANVQPLGVGQGPQPDRPVAR